MVPSGRPTGATLATVLVGVMLVGAGGGSLLHRSRPAVGRWLRVAAAILAAVVMVVAVKDILYWSGR